MPNPDVRAYVDLTLWDRDPQDVYDAAVADMRTWRPDLVLREGHTAATVLQGGAVEVAELGYDLNRLPSAIAAVIFGAFGVDVDSGSQPTVRIAVHVADALGHDIPAGLQVLLDLGEAVEPVVFTTTEGIAIPAGQTSGEADATGDRYTADANGTPALTRVEVVERLAYVDYAETVTVVGDGRDPETAEEWRDRAVLRVSRLTETLGQPHQFTAAAMERPEVGRALTLSNYDPAGAGAPGDDPGHVDVVVFGADGQVLTAPERDAIDADLSARALANLAVHVTDPTLTPVDVTGQIRTAAGYDPATVAAAVAARLAEYLNPNNHPWNGTVYRNELIAEIDRVEGVDRVVTLTVPAADVVLPGFAGLPEPGVLTITEAA